MKSVILNFHGMIISNGVGLSFGTPTPFNG